MRFIKGIGALAFAIFCAQVINAQNYYGLTGKKLEKLENPVPLESFNPVLDSIWRSFEGSAEGTMDSIMVMKDDEGLLKLKLYYTGFIKGTILVATVTESGKRESWIGGDLFSQEERNAPAEATLELQKNIPEGQSPASAFLR